MHIERSLVVSAAALSVILVSGAAQCGELVFALPASQVAELSAVVRSSVQARDDMPAGSNATVTWSEAPKAINGLKSATIFGVALIRFTGLTNSYCRLVGSVDGVATAKIIQVPVEANFDTCKKTGSFLIIDIDGDGSDDILFTVTVSSNRASAYIQEMMVFLGRRDVPGGYCYSSEASQQFSPDDLRSAKSAISAAHGALGRLGMQRFSCDRL